MAQVKAFNVHFGAGGLGDNIARLPAVRYLAARAPNTVLTVLVPDYFQELAYKLLHLPNVRYIRFSDALKDKAGLLFDPSAPAATTDGQHTTLKTHLTDHAFHTLCDSHNDSVLDKSYPTIPPPKHRLSRVILTTGYTAAVRQWGPAETVNKVARFCQDTLGYEVIWLGEKTAALGNEHKIEATFTEGVDYKIGHDLRGKTTLVEALAAINRSALVVGLDNGLLHLAGCTTTPVVAAYTNLAPALRIPYGAEKQWHAITPPKSTCNQCQSSAYLDLDSDFRLCPTYPLDATTCSRAISYVDWERAIRRALNV